MSTDEMIAKVDERFPGWDFYRTVQKRWLSRLNKDTLIESESFDGMLRQLLEYKVLPTIKRKPSLLCESDFKVCKSGARWEVSHRGYHQVTLPTKKEAERFIAQSIVLARERVEQWNTDFALQFPTGAQEGVDFRYES